ncbi:hypothetical protein GCM10027291_06300 [Telluribacter humicola]
MKRFVMWFEAHFLGYPYYRVTYQDSRITRLLTYSEAKALTEIFHGKLWLDYNAPLYGRT